MTIPAPIDTGSVPEQPRTNTEIIVPEDTVKFFENHNTSIYCNRVPEPIIEKSAKKKKVQSKTK